MEDFRKGEKLLNGWTKERVITAIQNNNLGKPSKGNESSPSSCVYFHKNGNRCGVGIFIADDLKEVVESRYNSEAYSGLPPEVRGTMPFDDDVMEALQMLHDDCEPNEDPRPLMIQFVEHLL
jgi:hypothetical protein